MGGVCYQQGPRELFETDTEPGGRTAPAGTASGLCGPRGAQHCRQTRVTETQSCPAELELELGTAGDEQAQER